MPRILALSGACITRRFVKNVSKNMGKMLISDCDIQFYNSLKSNAQFSKNPFKNFKYFIDTYKQILSENVGFTFKKSSSDMDFHFNLKEMFFRCCKNRD